MMAIWPTTLTNITSPYGERNIFNVDEFHTGIDISGNSRLNSSVYARASGTVVKAIHGNTGYGNYIVIDHGGDYYTLYGHCSALNVKEGDVVRAGQVIAYVGSTGNSTGPHLHFEIRIGGATMKNAQNPLQYVHVPVKYRAE